MIAPGQVFAGDYRVMRELGRGGMGAVYVVEQLSTGKQRALKLMSARLLSDAKAAERFLLEARVGSRVESEHVVEVIAAGIDESGSQRVPWLVMELLEGQSLEEAIATGGPMDPGAGSRGAAPALPRARRGAPRGPRPPRREAGQRLPRALEERHRGHEGEAARLRHRQGPLADRGRAGRRDRADGDADLHGARADAPR
ncbi:MAG: hypothetical protein M5U28_15775 [Sandaracinaceae bacterium]|nr:hypothetical protein [Sandaracinaceae bacterium]